MSIVLSFGGVNFIPQSEVGLRPVCVCAASVALCFSWQARSHGRSMRAEAVVGWVKWWQGAPRCWSFGGERFMCHFLVSNWCGFGVFWGEVRLRIKLHISIFLNGGEMLLDFTLILNTVVSAGRSGMF
jgi:hypothetical protein